MLENIFQDIENTPKNLPFFLTHLLDDMYINAHKDKLKKIILGTEIGRGSTFKHFYNNIIFKGTIDNLLFYKDIKGLSKSNFINALSRNIKKIPKAIILEIINYYLSDNGLFDYEIIEIFRIVIISGIDVIKGVFLRLDTSIIFSIINNIKSLNICSNVLDDIISLIQKKRNDSVVLHVMDNMLLKSESINGFNNFISLIYITLINYGNEFKKINLQKVYNLAAFITLFVEENEEGKIERIWEIFKDVDDKDLNINEWYKYDRNNKYISNFTTVTIVNFLTTVFRGDGTDSKTGKSLIEEQYAYSLILFLHDIKTDEKIEQIKEKVSEIITKHNYQYLQWCNDQASFYPCRKIALSNLQYNNRLVLKKENKLLVRGIKGSFARFDNIQNEKDSFLGKGIEFIIIDIQNKLENFNDKIDKKTLFQSLEFICEIFDKFENKGKRLNIFERGAFSDDSDNFHYYYSFKDKKFVINETLSIEINDNYIFNNMILIIKEKNIREHFYINYNCAGRIFLDSFFPKHLTNVKSKIDFIKSFLTFYHRKSRNNIYSLEYAKIMNLKKNHSTQSEFKSFCKFLNDYIYLYSKDYESSVFLGKVEIKKNNLLLLFDSLIKALKKNPVFDEKENFFVEGLKKEVDFINRLNPLDSFKKVNISNIKENYEKVYIENKLYNVSDLKVYRIGISSNTEFIDMRTIYSLLSSNNVYESNNILIVFPRSFDSLIEMIEKKEGLYDIDKFEFDNSISNDEFYSKALENIIIQNDIDKMSAKYRLHLFLQNVEPKYHHSILNVISSYKVMGKEEIDYFFKLFINNIKLNDTCCILPLKNIVHDYNGLHLLLFHTTNQFDRGTKYYNTIRNDWEKINKNKKINELIIVNDIGISGNQFINAFNIYLKETKNNKREYWNIIGEKFKRVISNIKKITVLTCIYTEVFEDNVCKFMKEIGYNSEIEFLGTKLKNESEYYFNKIDKVERDKFKEFILNNEVLANEKLPCGMLYKEYINNHEHDDTRNLLICRFKSLPKYHHLVFANDIFNYRKESY